MSRSPSGQHLPHVQGHTGATFNRQLLCGPSTGAPEVFAGQIPLPCLLGPQIKGQGGSLKSQVVLSQPQGPPMGLYRG